jgi:hypothetical protein
MVPRSPTAAQPSVVPPNFLFFSSSKPASALGVDRCPIFYPSRGLAALFFPPRCRDRHRRRCAEPPPLNPSRRRFDAAHLPRRLPMADAAAAAAASICIGRWTRRFPRVSVGQPACAVCPRKHSMALGRPKDALSSLDPWRLPPAVNLLGTSTGGYGQERRRGRGVGQPAAARASSAGCAQDLMAQPASRSAGVRGHQIYGMRVMTSRTLVSCGVNNDCNLILGLAAPRRRKM